MALHVLVLVFGVFCCSTAVIMIKASGIHPVALAFWRLAVATVFLTPLYLRDLRRSGGGFSFRDVRASLLPGLLLAIHFITWIRGARMTAAANASLIVNLVPVVMPLLMALLVRELVTKRELAGTALGMVGIVLLTGGDLHFWGDVVCFGSMLFFATYLALGRRNRDAAGLWLYVVPLYGTAAVLCLLACVPFTNPFRPYELHEYALILGLGLVPTVVGHSILNVSIRRLRGQVVSILNMGQFIFAGGMAYLFFGEVPPATLYAASVLLVGGAALAVSGRNGT